jgi:hypothetical protein
LRALAAPVRLEGVVVHGFKRGSKELGCPTANLDVEALGDAIAPLDTGIYFGWAALQGDVDAEGATAGEAAGGGGAASGGSDAVTAAAAAPSPAPAAPLPAAAGGGSGAWEGPFRMVMSVGW